MKNNKYIEIWRKKYLNKTNVKDRFGLEIKFNNYCNKPKKSCNKNSKCWTIDHIWPKSEEGYGGIANQEPLHCLNNQEKGNKMKGIVNKLRFSIIPAGEINEKVIGKYFDLPKVKYFSK